MLRRMAAASKNVSTTRGRIGVDVVMGIPSTRITRLAMVCNYEFWRESVLFSD